MIATVKLENDSDDEVKAITQDKTVGLLKMKTRSRSQFKSVKSRQVKLDPLLRQK